MRLSPDMRTAIVVGTVLVLGGTILVVGLPLLIRYLTMDPPTEDGVVLLSANQVGGSS